MTISEKMDKLLANQARQEQKLDDYAETQTKIEKVVFGNGKPGLVLDNDRNKRVIKIACWFIAAIVLASISVGGKLAYANIARWNADATTGATTVTAGS